ncbi:unnamed protein product [Sphagnum tenellum]
MTLTGKSFRTLKKRLENLTPEKHDGNVGIIYDIRAALPVIYNNEVPASKSISDYRFIREKAEASLAKAKAQKLRLEVNLMKNKLVPLENAERRWGSLVSGFRSKMLALPSRAALILHDMETVPEVEMALKEFIYEALNELSEDANLTAEESDGNPAPSDSSSEAETD